MATKILVVDDEEAIAELIMVNLVRAGFMVTTASDGEEAWELIQMNKPDFIVTDVNMPRLDGFGLVKRIKTNAATKTIPVVMLTARAADADVFKGWQFGADEYLTKPFNPEQLLFIINKIIKARADEVKAKLKDKYVIGGA